MKAIIVSDIHGSGRAADKIALLSKDADLILCLGDILYHGPRNDLPEGHDPKHVISVLNPLAGRIVAVRGNCEAEVDQMVLSFPVLGTTASVFLDSRRIDMSHGHIYNEENPIPGASVMLYGHTHIPVAERKDGTVFFNPGSMSLPKGGWPTSYGLYEDGRLSVHRVDDDSLLMEISLT